MAWWPEGGGGGGALKSKGGDKIRNCLTRYVKSSLSTDSKW